MSTSICFLLLLAGFLLTSSNGFYLPSNYPSDQFGGNDPIQFQQQNWNFVPQWQAAPATWQGVQYPQSAAAFFPSQQLPQFGQPPVPQPPMVLQTENAFFQPQLPGQAGQLFGAPVTPAQSSPQAAQQTQIQLPKCIPPMQPIVEQQESTTSQPELPEQAIQTDDKPVYIRWSPPDAEAERATFQPQWMPLPYPLSQTNGEYSAVRYDMGTPGIPSQPELPRIAQPTYPEPTKWPFEPLRDGEYVIERWEPDNYGFYGAYPASSTPYYGGQVMTTMPQMMNPIATPPFPYQWEALPPAPPVYNAPYSPINPYAYPLYFPSPSHTTAVNSWQPRGY